MTILAECTYRGKRDKSQYGVVLQTWRTVFEVYRKAGIDYVDYLDGSDGLGSCTVDAFSAWTRGLMRETPVAVKYGSGCLLKAAVFVEAIPEHRFNMMHWWLPDGTAFDDDANRVYRVADGPCGCAAGNMASEGMFGLSLDLFSNQRGYIFARLADLFAIRTNAARFIFDAYSYQSPGVTRADVARRMRFVASEAAGARLNRDMRLEARMP